MDFDKTPATIAYPQDQPWFKDLTQVKRFVNLRAYRAFDREKNRIGTDSEFEKIKEIFKAT